MASLKSAIGTLARLYPAGPVLRDPLQIILWENIGYLIDDDRRAELFAEFGRRVGFDARAIAKAPTATLMDIAMRGGMRPGTRVERWREIARLVLTEAGGDLGRALKTLPLPKGRALLKKFPVIGDPGADKVLLFACIAPLSSVESNGLRTLVRLGFCVEEKSYPATYKNAVRALSTAFGPDAKALTAAYTALREHGRTICKRGKPLCLVCPLDKVCAHVLVSRL